MTQEKIKNIVEAALMAANKPLNIDCIMGMFAEVLEFRPAREDIRVALKQLHQDYHGRGIELVEVASGYRVQTRNDYAEWINRLFEERPPRYSRALLETLSIIAYRQPITRAEIEDIRGVSVSGSIIRTLQERAWIKVVGHRDVPGKPALLATTKTFLDYFNLKRLSDLPALIDIKDFDAINPDLFDELEREHRETVLAETEKNQEIHPVDTTVGEPRAENITASIKEDMGRTEEADTEGRITPYNS